MSEIPLQDPNPLVTRSHNSPQTKTFSPKFIRRISGVDIEGEHDEDNQGDEELENGGAASFFEEELRGMSAAEVLTLAAGGVPDVEKLGGHGGGAVVASKLDEDEDQQVGDSSNGGYVEKVPDVVVPGVLQGSVAGGGERVAFALKGGDDKGSMASTSWSRPSSLSPKKAYCLYRQNEMEDALKSLESLKSQEGNSQQCSFFLNRHSAKIDTIEAAQ